MRRLIESCFCLRVSVSVSVSLSVFVSPVVCRQLRRDLEGLQEENHRLQETLLQVSQALELHVKNEKCT
jgi:hypothetical protein